MRKNLLAAAGLGGIVGFFVGLALFAVSELTFAQTVAIPPQTVTVTIPAQTVTIPAQTVTVAVTPPPVIVVTPPPVIVPPPASTTAWGYHAGVWSWAGDYSYAAKITYGDTVGNPSGKDIAVSLTSAWGAWQPFMAANWKYSTAGYTKLTFSLKPTRVGQHWNVFFVGVGDVALAPGCGKDVLAYGPAPVAGQWATYTVPLADLCVGGGIDIYKFDIQDQTGAAVNTWYVNDVGFTN